MRSKELFLKSSTLLPGGVSSPVRRFLPNPFFTSRGSGSKLYTEDGTELIDYCMAYGPLVFGHAPSFVIEAVHQQIANGSVYGTPHWSEVELAEEVKRSIPSVSMVRFVNSGGEAASVAIRLARAYTKHLKIIKFDGSYHGAIDPLMVNSVGGYNTSFSEGVPTNAILNTVVLPFNDFTSLDVIGEDTACVIVEPIMGNVGVIPPEKGFLEELEKACKESGSLLIFDEVITGFRLSKGGAQKIFGITPDITILGKILGGGFPIGAIGGREEIMRMIAPEGKVFNAGTFNGNPVSMVAGLATLKRLNDRVYIELDEKCSSICSAIKEIFDDAGESVKINRVGSMFTLFFNHQPVRDKRSAIESKSHLFMELHRLLINKGVYLPPSQFESCFISTTHSSEDFERTVDAFTEVATKLSKGHSG